MTHIDVEPRVSTNQRTESPPSSGMPMVPSPLPSFKNERTGIDRRIRIRSIGSRTRDPLPFRTISLPSPFLPDREPGEGSHPLLAQMHPSIPSVDPGVHLYGKGGNVGFRSGRIPSRFPPIGNKKKQKRRRIPSLPPSLPNPSVGKQILKHEGRTNRIPLRVKNGSVFLFAPRTKRKRYRVSMGEGTGREKKRSSHFFFPTMDVSRVPCHHGWLIVWMVGRMGESKHLETSRKDHPHPHARALPLPGATPAFLRGCPSPSDGG